MFSNLRQNNQVYILHKPSDLKIGTVTSVTAPLKYMQHTPNWTTDIKVDVDGQSVEFKQLPSSMGIAFYDNGNTIISDDRESISSEIQNMIKNSKDVLNSIPYHKEVIEKGEELLKELNPEFAKQKEQEEKIISLESKVGGIENKLDNITNLLTKAINGNSNKTL